MKRIHIATIRACSRLTDHSAVSIIGLALILMASAASPAWGQWTCASGVCSTTSNVGIGTIAPNAPVGVYYNQTYSYPTPGQTTGAIHMSALSGPGPGYEVDSALTFGGPSAYWGGQSGYDAVALSGIYSQALFGMGSILYFATTNDFNAGSKVRVMIDQNGSLGIGTTSPQTTLDVVESGNNDVMRIANTVGSNRAYLDFLTYNGSGDVSSRIGAVDMGSYNNSLVFEVANNGAPGSTTTEAMRILNTGNVGIGTTNPQQLLDVAGTMAAREIIVTQTGADYVFNPAYRLAPLSEVADYIKENHHLPDVPSAQEMQKNGASVGDMQAKLLAKVEELTLHMIEADERSKRDEERNKTLEQQNRELQERIARLEAAGHNPENHEK